MHVAGPEADHRDRRRDVDDVSRSGRPASALREHPEDGGLVQPEGGVAGRDAHHHFLRSDPIPIPQGEDCWRRIEALAVAEDLAEIGQRLLRPAQDRLLAGEDLHRHHRVEVLGGKDAARSLEVDIGRLAGKHLGSRLESRTPRLVVWRRLVGHGAAV